MDYTRGMQPLTTRQAAEAVGIDRVTLQRWIAGRLVKAPKAVVRGGRAVRLWSEADLERLRSRKEEIYRKGRGRKPASNS
jgi:predicted DNA-binding transcriptional regulator AlpA